MDDIITDSKDTRHSHIICTSNFTATAACPTAQRSLCRNSSPNLRDLTENTGVAGQGSAKPGVDRSI